MFNRVKMTTLRLLLLIIAVAGAATIAVLFAADEDETYLSTTYVFTSQLLREDRTDDELGNVVDDLILAVDIDPVVAAVEEETGLTLDSDFVVVVERATAGGDTVEIVAEASTPEDAEAASAATGRAALDFVIGQDQARAAATQETNQSAVVTIRVRQDELTVAAGGVSPDILHAEAQTDLAVLINARPIGVAPTAAELSLRARVAALAGPSREYEQLAAQLAGYQFSELGQLDTLSQSASALAALDSDIVVNGSTEAKSLAPKLIQAGVAAGLVMAAVGIGFFALIDSAARRRAGRRASAAARAKASRGKTLSADSETHADAEADASPSETKSDTEPVDSESDAQSPSELRRRARRRASSAAEAKASGGKTSSADSETHADAEADASPSESKDDEEPVDSESDAESPSELVGAAAKAGTNGASNADTSGGSKADTGGGSKAGTSVASKTGANRGSNAGPNRGPKSGNPKQRGGGPSKSTRGDRPPSGANRRPR